jgi:hypothetical protein
MEMLELSPMLKDSLTHVLASSSIHEPPTATKITPSLPSTENEQVVFAFLTGEWLY